MTTRTMPFPRSTASCGLFLALIVFNGVFPSEARELICSSLYRTGLISMLRSTMVVMSSIMNRGPTALTKDMMTSHTTSASHIMKSGTQRGAMTPPMASTLYPSVCRRPPPQHTHLTTAISQCKLMSYVCLPSSLFCR